jgi:BspA type Leucine rich repeat region (6 copies)/Secretion system C-terminal sorting domain/SprB repeat
MKKQLFFTLALFWCTLMSFGQGFNYLGINYSFISQTTVEVGSNSGFSGAANIPATVVYLGSNYAVTSIGQQAFYSSTGLTSVTIPNSVTNIGDLAFFNCTGLTSVTIPNSVTSIGANAFDSCTGLISVSIPNSVTSIGIGAFNYCIILTSVNIPNSVTSISDYAFASCSGLTSVTIPNSVNNIGSYAFANCTGLTSVTIPNSVTSINNYAFENCTGLTSVTVNWSTPIGTNANVFQNVAVSGVYLYVPVDNVGAYQAFAPWNNFNIAEQLSATQSQYNVPCFGGSIGNATVDAIGGFAPYNYSWSPSGGNGATAYNLTAGNYTCIINDFIGNSITKNFTITQPDALSANQSQTNVSCFGGDNGIAEVIVAGGTVPYTYLWSNNNTTNALVGVASGSYSVTITDANSCSITKNFTILQPIAVLAINQFQTDVSCRGGSNGSISLYPTGGTAPYTYVWGDGNTSQSRTGLAAGSYSVTVTDNVGCTATKNFNIYQPAAIAVSPTQTNVSCGGVTLGSISLTTFGGIAPYNYLWENGSTSADRTGLTEGSYSVIITDANTCTITRNFEITQPIPTEDVTTITACDSYTWNGTTYSETGIYTGTTTNCITEKLNLTITPSTENVTPITTCDSYTWNGTTYNQTGIYIGTTTNCITEKLNLTITPSTTLIQANQACVSYTWPANGETYTQSGSYTAVNGCQTTIMNLTINQPVTVNFIETACDSYFWSRNDATYTTSGTYTFVSGCVTSVLNLTITPSTTNITTVSAFGNYIWPANGETLSTTLIGYEFPNGNCNTEILNLTIIPATVIITNENGVLNAVTNAPNATYQWYNCISEQIIAGQTGATFTPTQSGSYNVLIRINGILSGSAGCFNYTFLANDTFSGIAGIDLYPNPSNGIINLKLPIDLQVEIYNNLGQMLSSEKMFTGSNVINISDKPAGVYFLKANDGNNVSTFKIIKN